MLKFRQPEYRKGEFYGWHYWGWLEKGSFVAPLGAINSPSQGQRLTGIKDRNGTDIIEGDIIQHYAFELGDVFVVSWNEREGCWGGFGAFSEWKDCVIVGNVVENPELVPL